MDLNSHDLFARALKVSPGGVHSPVRAFKGVGGDPVFFKSAKGAYLTSVEGDRYIDFCQSFGPHILGHLDEDVMREVRFAIEDVWSLGACEPYSLELAEYIQDKIPFIDKIRFVCSGTEAVMSALRVARAATKRELVLKFDGCYHGHADALLVKAGSGLATQGIADSAGVSARIAESTVVAELDNIHSVEQAFLTYPNQIAAVILEPLPANYGLLLQRKEFLLEVIRLAKKNGALVIFDEVISGFRVAFGGMAEVLQCEPDLVTYGKIIGGGFPVGAYAGRKDLMSLVAPEGPVYQAGTLSASPVGMRAGLATLKKIKSQNVYATLEKRTFDFATKIESAMSELDIPLRVAKFSSVFWLYLEQNKAVRSVLDFHPRSKEFYGLLFHNALKSGLYLAPSAFEVGFVSLAHTEDILNESAQIIIDSAKRAHVEIKG